MGAPGSSLRLKRTIDVIAASTLLVVFAIPLAICAIAVRTTMGAPVLFRQVRIGMREQPFELVKFRTMRASEPGEDELLTDADRITRIGRFLRASSLDELPSLVNVLRGEMSLVGPRPLLPEYLPLYTPEERRRHCVRPGLTGLAQVSGRQDLTFRQRFALDVEYVDSISLGIDVRILLRTLRAVVSSDGVRTGQSFSDVDDIGARDAVRRRPQSERA